MKKRSITLLVAVTCLLAACGEQNEESLPATHSESKTLAQDQKESLALEENEEEPEDKETNEESEEESTGESSSETEENVTTKKKDAEEEMEVASTSDSEVTDESDEEIEQKEEQETESEPEAEPEQETEPEPEAEPEQEQQPQSYEAIHHTRGPLTADGSTGATVQTESGAFTIEASLKNIQTLQSGPVQVQLKSASKISGEITEPSLAGVAGENVEYIQLDAVVTNTSGDPILFYLDNTRLDSGSHSFYANEMFSASGRGYGDLQPYTEHHITLFYMLDGVSIGDVYSIYGLTDAPTNQASGAAVGEPMKFQFSFTGA
ncbi:hypothetical protein NSQ54_06770 [Alkalihalobacillus sp. FSL W8-0930]